MSETMTPPRCGCGWTKLHIGGQWVCPANCDGTWREPRSEDDTTVEFLTEIIDYFERLKNRAKVRGGPDTSAMGIADEAIGLCREALADATQRRVTSPAATEALAAMLDEVMTHLRQEDTTPRRIAERLLAKGVRPPAPHDGRPTSGVSDA